MQQDDDKALAQARERGRVADHHAKACAATCVTMAIGLLAVNAAFMFSTEARRVTLTTLDVFDDWAALRMVFQGTTSYDPRFNPPSLDFFTSFDGAHTRLDLLQDLVTRGLMTEQRFSNMSAMFNASTGAALWDGVDPKALTELSAAFVSKFMGTTFFGVNPAILTQPVEVMSHHFKDPRLLVRLFGISGCSFPDAVSGTTPATRSPGCACIADTYLRFVRATANMTSNVTLAPRDEASDRVMRCMDRRVTWQAWAAGSVWTIHLSALAFYSSGILFLVCSAFLLSFHHYDLFPEDWDGETRTRAIQGVLVVFTGVMILLLMLHAPLSNGLYAVGLLLSLSTFIFSVPSVLAYQVKGEQGVRTPFKPEPHPLMVCFWLNCPLILPGPLVAVAVGGYTRDIYAVWTVALAGAMIGIVFMRLFWYIWNDDHSLIKVVLPSMLLFVLDLVIMLFVWLLVYRVQGGGVFSISGIGPILVVLLWVLFTLGFLWYELHVFLESVEKKPNAVKDLNQRFEEGEHTSVVFLTLGVLVWFTVVACIDSSRA